MNIRPEKVQDYAAIAEVNIRAFDERLAEALIVTLHRQRPQFDPELSLVAEIDGVSIRSLMIGSVRLSIV